MWEASNTTITMRRLLSVLLLVLLTAVTAADGQEQLQCSLSEEDVARRDPNLHEMTYDVGDGPQTTWVYVEPPVETFYAPGQTPPAKTKVVPKFNGLAGKFINMSNQPVTLYWCVRFRSFVWSLFCRSIFLCWPHSH